MNTTVAVFTRELRENSRIFFVAAALILIPFIAAVFPWSRGNRADAIAATGGGAAVVYGLSLALALGVSIIGRELREKRLSFYFAKPLSALALWSGKALAALVTIFGAMAIIALPTMVFSPDVWSSPGRALLPAVLFLCVALFLVTHAVGTMVRSRSGVIGIDLACAAAVAFVAFLLARQLLIGGAHETAVVMAKIAAWAVLAVLAAAPLYQLAHGRTDVRRSHLALSRFVWSGLAVILIAAAAFVGWLATAPLSSITTYGAVEQTPKGDWVLMSGRSSRAGYVISGLVNARTGEKKTARIAPWYNQVISRDGSTLATMELAEWSPRKVLVNIRVGPFADRENTVLIEPPDRVEASALSHDGSRLVVAMPTAVSVYETNRGRMMMSVRFEGNEIERMYFPSPSIVRIHTRGLEREAIHELDLARRTIAKTGELPVKNASNLASEDGSRIYLRRESMIADGRTGALIAKVPVQPLHFFSAAMMNDGRAAVIAVDGLHLYDRDGRELKTIAIPLMARPGIRAQIGDSKLIVGSGMKTMIVDVDQGTVGAAVDNLRGPFGSWHELRLKRFPEDATIAMLDDEMKIVLWDVRTGERRPLPL
jgi:hypothetical protein